VNKVLPGKDWVIKQNLIFERPQKLKGPSEKLKKQ
jgi:hypothetical protein